MQNQKSGNRLNEKECVLGIAEYMDEIWDDDTLYICGTGSTILTIMDKLGMKGSLLGVDISLGRKILKKDCSEKEILDTVRKYKADKKDLRIIILVTVIGGQGYILGRGNQQISGEVIKMVGKENIVVAAARGKINDMFGKPLYADTGSLQVNEYLKGYVRVIMGYDLESVKKVSN